MDSRGERIGQYFYRYFHCLLVLWKVQVRAKSIHAERSDCFECHIQSVYDTQRRKRNHTVGRHIENISSVIFFSLFFLIFIVLLTGTEMDGGGETETQSQQQYNTF